MTLAIVVEAWLGGVRRHLLLLLPELQRLGWEITIFASTQRLEADFAADQAHLGGLGIQLLPLSMQRSVGPSDLVAISWLRQELKARRPSILWCHSTKAGLIGRLAAVGLGRERRPAVVYSPHCFYYDAYPAWHPGHWIAWWIEKALGLATQVIIAISKEEGHRALRFCRRVAVAPNGLPADFQDSLLPRSDARAALGIGKNLAVAVPSRLAPQKGIDILLQALARIPAGIRPVAAVHIFGAGPQEKHLKAMAQTLAVEDSIVWHGYRADLWRYLKAFDFAIMPSRYEGLSYAMLETLSAGIPVLASDCHGHREVLPPDATIGLLPKANVEALATALETWFLQPPAWPETMAERTLRSHGQFRQADIVHRTLKHLLQPR